MITDSELIQLRRDIYLALVAKSGVREWEEAATHQSLWLAAIDASNGLLEIVPDDPDEGEYMALPDWFKITSGTAKTIRNSGGDAAITLANLANGNGTSAGARQSVTVDLGEDWARRWRITSDLEFAPTPTAGNTVNFLASWASATGAGKGNTSGTDSAYTGYNNNIDAATKQLEFIGAHNCTSQATATVQKAFVGVFFPKARYMNLVVDNRSGAALHSADTNMVITITPLEEKVQDLVT